MFQILSLKQEAVGLDINDSSLKILKLKKKRSNFVIESFNNIKIESGIVENGVIKNEEVLAKIIKSALSSARGKKITAKNVIVGLPEEKSFLQIIKMPKMSIEELKLAVPLEAENYIPMSINDVYLDFEVICPAGFKSSTIDVLVVAEPKKIINSYVSCIKKAGLQPVIFEAESQSIARALVKNGNTSSLLLIDFGENNIDFNIFAGGCVRFTCSISIGSRSLTEAISKALKISFDQAERLKIRHGLSSTKTNSKAGEVCKIITPILKDVAVQIKKYLDFYQEHSFCEGLAGKKGMEKAIFCGGGSKLDGLAEFMFKELSMPVELGHPLINFSKNSEGRRIKSSIYRQLPEFSTAIGLALREFNGYLE